MKFFFCPLLEKFDPLLKHFVQLGSILPRQYFILPTFKVRPGKGVFSGGVGADLCMYISLKGFCGSQVKNRVLWWYSGQNDTPYGQNETHMGILYEKWEKVLKNWGKKFQSSFLKRMERDNASTPICLNQYFAV